MTDIVVHCKAQGNPCDRHKPVYVGRNPNSVQGFWGNHYTHKVATIAKFKVDTVEEAVARYQHDLVNDMYKVGKAQAELKGQVLSCWCGFFTLENLAIRPWKCHALPLYVVANKIEPYYTEIMTK